MKELIILKCGYCKNKFEKNPCGNFKYGEKRFCCYKCYNEFLKVIEKKKWEKIKDQFEYTKPKELKLQTLKKKYSKNI